MEHEVDLKNQIRVMNIGLILKVHRWHIIFTGL